MNQMNQGKLTQSSRFFLSAVCIVINPLCKYTRTIRDATRTLLVLITRGQADLLFTVSVLAAYLCDGVTGSSGHKEFMLYHAQRRIHTRRHS